MAASLLKDMEKIWVVRMIDPATFWFISARDDDLRQRTDRKLAQLLDQDSSSTSAQSYVPIPGELVAVSYPLSDKWHRGEVQSIGSSSGLLVFLLDHGIATTVPTSNIRKLPDTFCSDFHASRLRLRGLEVVCMEKLTAKGSLNWDSEAYTFVAGMLKKAKSCYISSDPTSFNMVGNTLFGELYLEINGTTVNLIDSIVEKKFAVRSKYVADEERSYKVDPLGISLGTSLYRQVDSPMQQQMIDQHVYQYDDEDACGIAIMRKKPESTQLFPPAEVVKPVPPRTVRGLPVKFFPAGINIGNPIPKVTAVSVQKPERLINQHKQASHQNASPICAVVDSKVQSKETSPVALETLMMSVSSDSGASPISPTEGKPSRRTMLIQQKLMLEKIEGTKCSPKTDLDTLHTSDLTSDLQEEPKLGRRSLRILQELKKLEVVASDSEPKTETAETLVPSPGTSNDPKTSKRTLMLRNQLLKAKANTSASSPKDSSFNKVQEHSEIGGKQQYMHWQSSGDATNTFSGPSYHQSFKPEEKIQSNEPPFLNSSEKMTQNDARSSSPNNLDDEFKFQNCCRDTPPFVHLETDSEMLTMDKIIAHARDYEPEQIQTYQEANFPDLMHKVLGKMYPISKPLSRLQKYVWPAIFRNENVIMVEPPNDLIMLDAYLVPLISQLMNKSSYSTLPESNGPIAIILCSGAQFGEKVLQRCSQFLQMSPGIRVVLTHGGGAELEKMVDLTNGCEILISTPHCFVKLLGYSKVLVNFDRLCHLVLEKADLLLESFQSEVNAIMNLCKEAKRRHIRKGILNPLQVIAGSEQWSLVLYSMVHDITPYPLVCISSYSEAAIYAAVRPKMDILGTGAKPNKIIGILEEKNGRYKTVVVCLTNVDAMELKTFLEEKTYRILVAHEKLHRFELDDIRREWNTPMPIGHYPVLICTDTILPLLMIYDAMCLIHYNLPKKKTPFGTRFTCLLNNFPNINRLTINNKSPLQCEVHIFVDQLNREQLPGVVRFMDRLGAKISPSLTRAAKEIAFLTESDKVTVPFCSNLKAFGTCWNKTSCKERHAVIHKDLQGNLPKTGRVRLKILSVLNTSCFSARMLEVTHLDGSTQTFKDEYLTIAMELALHFSQPNNQRMHGTPKLGDVCAVESKIGLFQRALVVSITADERTNNPTSVRVHLMDNGNDIEHRVMKLLHLPQHLRDVPAQAVEVFLCHVVPADHDVAWSLVSYNTMVKWFEDADRNERFGSYIVGDIKLSLSNTLWLDPLHIKRSLPTVETDVTAVALRRKLIDNNMANKNHTHLENLYVLCRQAGMDIPPSYFYTEIITQKKLEPLVVPRWAHLWEEDSMGVVFLAADMLSQLFIRQIEFDSNVKQLTSAIQSHIAERSSSLTSLGSEGLIIKDGLVCLGKTLDSPTEDGTWHRAIVTGITDSNQVELFFVDHGDRATVDATSISPIEDRFITYLPFQAIECSLAGIQPLDEVTWDKAIDRLYDLTIDNQMRAIVYDFNILKVEESANCTGGHKYVLALIDPNAIKESVINRIFIEEGFAGWNPEEENFLRDLPKIVDKVEDSSDCEDTLGRNTMEDNVSPNNNTVATLSPSRKDTDLIKLSDLKGVQVKALNETEDTVIEEGQRCIDIEIDDVQKFLFNMCHGKALEAEQQKRALAAPQTLPISSSHLVQTDMSNNTTDDVLSSDSEDLFGTNSGTGRKPHVTWYQDLDYVHLSIELVDVQVYDLRPEPMRLTFSTRVGEDDYSVDMNFFGAVNPEEIQNFSTGRRVCIKLQKIYRANWPHLLKTRDKDYFWLKYNIEHADDGGTKIVLLNNGEAAAAESITREEGILADFQYNDSESESENSDYVEEDKPYEFHDIYDPLN